MGCRRPPRRRAGWRPERASREALDAALEGLPERDRAVIHMRVWDRLSFAEIGGRIDLSEDAAGCLMPWALARLRGSLEARP